jgi:hypothetical protein
MIVTVLYRLAGEPTVSGGAAFSDVDSDQYYANAVAWASANGIVYGIGENKYAPDRDISRQDLATILIRYEEFAKLNLPPIKDSGSFADNAKIADYAVNAVDTLYQGGVINGKPNNLFDPQGDATRAEFAAMLHRFIENVK